MNLEKIVKNVLAEAEKLQQGDKQEQGFGNELAALAEKIEAYREANKRPMDKEAAEKFLKDNSASTLKPLRPEWPAKRNWRG